MSKSVSAALMTGLFAATLWGVARLAGNPPPSSERPPAAGPAEAAGPAALGFAAPPASEPPAPAERIRVAAPVAERNSGAGEELLRVLEIYESAERRRLGGEEG